ncbi:penicillin-binding protein activator [Vogesella oryzae]|uniref:penicillin-binding protein activator n=1 Tax=Vogesella oryzae TaxID=1735285 RepID=UPI00158295DF|nr:penicillin-binding protein activator [Vogesella oryzae]
MQPPPAGKAASSPAVAVAAPVVAARPGSKSLHIGLLLPLASPQLKEAAQVVKDGFDAAAAANPDSSVQVSVSSLEDDSKVLDGYRQLAAQGASFIVGPLTRQGAANLAQESKLPTLVLNTLDKAPPAGSKVWSLTLAVETEAPQIVRLLRDDGRQQPLLLFNGDGLSQRLRQAFAEFWVPRGAKPLAELDISNPDGDKLNAALASSDAVILALDSKEAAATRALLPPTMPVYASSLVNIQQPPAVMQGVRFVDMPWFLMPDHPETRGIARPTSNLTRATERLYALGVDAYRLAVALAGSKNAALIKLGGATGDLRIGKGWQVQRELPSSVVGNTQ